MKGGVKDGKAIKTVTSIGQDFQTLELEELPVALKYHCSTVYAGQVFVIGGQEDTGFPKKTVYMLMTGRSWRIAAVMITARYMS